MSIKRKMKYGNYIANRSAKKHVRIIVDVLNSEKAESIGTILLYITWLSLMIVAVAAI